MIELARTEKIVEEKSGWAGTGINERSQVKKLECYKCSPLCSRAGSKENNSALRAL